MSAITSNGTGGGNWDTGSTWSGGTPPGVNDTATIAATDTVTLRTDITTGSDPGFGGTAAINVLGQLQFDTSASRTLILYGDLTISTSGKFLIGLSGSRVPAANTITVKFNASSAMVTGKYGLRVTYGTANKLQAYGALKTTNVVSNGTTNSGQKVITLTGDISGWRDGDVVEVYATDGSVGSSGNHTEEMTIAAGGVSGQNVTMTANFTNTHASGCIVSNTTKNIVFRSYDTSHGWFADTRFGTLANHVLDNVELDWTGTPSTNITGVEGYSINGNNGSQLSTGQFSQCSFYKGTTNGSIPHQAQLVIFGGNGGRNCTVANCVFTGANNSISGISVLNATYNTTLSYCNFNGLANSGVHTEFGTGSTLTYLQNCNFVNNAVAIQSKAADQIICSNNSYQGNTNAWNFYYINYNHFDTSSSYGTVIPNTYTINISSISSLILTFNQCTLSDTNLFSGQSNILSGTYVDFLNCTIGGTANLFRRYVTYGYFNQSSTSLNSSMSMALNSTSTGTIPYNFTFLASNGVPYTLLANMQINTHYRDGAYTYPSITISGLGITPVVANATSASSNAWESQTLNVTQNSGADGLLTVTFSGNSATATGIAYFDGLVAPPFVTKERWYGYLLTNTLPTQTVNPYVVASYSTAGAYSGIAIVGNTSITLTTTHSMQELYDYSEWWSVQTANMGYNEVFSTADGKNFTTTYNLIINGVALTGSGTINLGSGTLTFIGAGSSTINITNASGTQTNINVTNLISGSRVQLYDVTTSTELYNAVVGATSLTFPILYTSGDTIRLRVMYVSGATTAYYWYTATGTLTNTGLTFVAAQVENTVYEASNIDGSLVTALSVSGTTIRIYVNDPTNNTIQAQAIYNWYQYYLFTHNGIRDQDGTYITATDNTHFIFQNVAGTGMKIVNQDTIHPLQVTSANITPSDGGTSTNIFDLTNGASMALNFNRVEGFSYSSGSGLSTAEHNQLMAVPLTIPRIVTDGDQVSVVMNA